MVPNSSRHTLVRLKLVVLLRVRVPEPLGQSIIHDVDDALSLVTTDEKVGRLDVTVDQRLSVHVFDAADHLDGNLKDSLQ